jgi:hypothetical protein
VHECVTFIEERKRTGDVCSGWPSVVTCAEVRAEINQHIRDNRKINIDKITGEMVISY